jgi:NAD/NADP transhydrogenase beta subunit
MGRDVGPVIVAVGVVVALVGVLAWTGGLSWFGRLPGDIRIERENVRVYVPLVSMLLVSLVVTILLSLFRR